MKIEVKIIKENKDGSANAQVDFDKAGLETLIQWGLVAMLTKAVNEYAIRPDDAEVSIQPKSKRSVAQKKPLAKKSRITKEIIETKNAIKKILKKGTK